eukprot:1258227-Prymnesium_polylepis.1
MDSTRTSAAAAAGVSTEPAGGMDPTSTAAAAAAEVLANPRASAVAAAGVRRNRPRVPLNLQQAARMRAAGWQPPPPQPPTAQERYQTE